MSDEEPRAPVAGEPEPDTQLAETWETPASDEDELVDYLKQVDDVESLFLEMKDVSELAVDLAYSALLYDSEDIAEEVVELEDIIDTLQHRMQRRAMEGLRAGEMDTGQALAFVRLANAAEQISDAAAEIADVVLRDFEVHPVLAAMIRESDAIITRARVQESSFVVGKTLSEVALESETGMRAIAIKRGPTWIYGPGGDAVLEREDVIVARGPPEGETQFQQALDGTLKGWD